MKSLPAVDPRLLSPLSDTTDLVIVDIRNYTEDPPALLSKRVAFEKTVTVYATYSPDDYGKPSLLYKISTLANI